ncbi:Hypothetical predicted protein [Mytilus galloprovincialis]|uniref:Uncharacterized protein n=1 Tax=Mytilus galloprovincialis TaxID=29158 RepID=A0A8B6BGA1_MYTGA|nr:Hypothetical predicted protein [Mytilus galloprovincialis]
MCSSYSIKDGESMMEVERNDLEDEIQTIPENGNTSLVDSKTSIVDVTFEEEISTTTDSLVIECSSIRVGSLKGTSLVPVIISTKYIEFKFMIEGERSVHCIKLQSDDILQCLYGQMYGVIFIVTNIEAGIKIRSVLGMKKKVKGKSHLDPGGSVGKGLFVTFFIAFPCNLQNEQLKNVLQCYKNFANEEFLIELDEHSQHKILLETSPNTGQEKKELVILKALTRAASTDFNNNFVSGEATQTAVEMYKFKPEGEIKAFYVPVLGPGGHVDKRWHQAIEWCSDCGPCPGKCVGYLSVIILLFWIFLLQKS